MLSENFSFTRAMQHMAAAHQYFEDAGRDSKSDSVRRLAKSYRDKAKWMIENMQYHPAYPLPQETWAEILNSIKQDPLWLEAVTEKLAKIPNQAREAMEAIIDAVLSGETIKAVETRPFDGSRCGYEQAIEEYFGLPEDTPAYQFIKVDFGKLCDLLCHWDQYRVKNEIQP